MSAGRTAVAATLVLAAGLAVAHAATDGFAAFTLESARRLHALRAPAPLPAVTLELADGGKEILSGLSGRVLLVDFVYTACPTLCVALGSVYARLQRRLAAEIAAGDVQLVSISFDPARDEPGALRAYRARHGASPEGWVLGRPLHAAELKRTLEAFGVVVIPDGRGGFVHNAAVHVVGPDRRLVAIVGFDDLEAVAGQVAASGGGQRHDVALR